jgi:DNA-binding NarL/FixJ family response regulator
MKIYIIDDHKLVAEGIANLLKSIEKVEQVEVFTSTQQFLSKVKSDPPNLTFIDLVIGDEDGRDVLSAVKLIHPNLPCFVISMINEKHVIEDCIAKGATGFMCKDCDFEDLQTVIKSPNDYFLSKEVLKTILGKSTVNTFRLLEPLTLKEKEVLREICDGLSPREISDKLFLSTRTVETHKNNIMQKFEVKSVSKLIVLAIKHKVI